MKRTFLLFLPFLCLLAGTLASCEEVEEAGKYDNWRERNEAFADSIGRLAGGNIVVTAEHADAMEPGKLYAIETTASTTEGRQYVYCKKLVANKEGERPLYSGHHSTVSTFYYGTLITGDRFDGNFSGYSALDTDIPLPPEKGPTAFDASTTFGVSEVVVGWTAALQLMRTGERWMLYLPWQSGYGASGMNDIPGYTTLVFDMVLESIVE